MSDKYSMTLKRWYGSTIRIPTYKQWYFTEFVASGLGIVRSIVEEAIGKEINIQFKNIDTAAADQENATIYISQKFLEGNLPGGREPVDSDTAISTIMGMIVHESAHFAYSPATLTPWADYIRERTSHKFNDMVSRILGNVIEDIFIEAEIDRRIPNLTWMMNVANSVMFTDEDIRKRFENAEPVTEPPLLLEGVAKVVDFLILAKTRSSVETSNKWLKDMFLLVRTATVAFEVEQRLELAFQVYEELMQNVWEMPKLCLGKGKGEGEDGESVGLEGEGDGPEGEVSDSEGKSSGGKGEAGSEASPLTDRAKEADEKRAERKLREVDKDAKGVNADHEGGDLKKTGRFGGTSTSHKVEDLMERMKGSKVDMVEPDRTLGDIKDATRLFIEKPLAMASSSVSMDPRYSRLAEVARQRATSNKPYGMDTRRGHSIRKLYRIGTDQKIFADPLQTHNYKPMQVLILIDCSGSMTEGYDGWKNGKMDLSGSRIEKAVQAALGAAYGLSEGRCEVAVYGHTADSLGGNEVIIYRAKTFNESLAPLGHRLQSLLEGLDLRQNRDGFAITHVAKKFTAVNKRRLMIVISDGEPAAPGYSGGDADNHTQKSVEKVRQQGIDVLSISITDSANLVNNKIYGKEWNIFNEDPGVIDEVIRTMVLK